MWPSFTFDAFGIQLHKTNKSKNIKENRSFSESFFIDHQKLQLHFSYWMRFFKKTFYYKENKYVILNTLFIIIIKIRKKCFKYNFMHYLLIKRLSNKKDLYLVNEKNQIEGTEIIFNLIALSFGKSKINQFSW